MLLALRSLFEAADVTVTTAGVAASCAVGTGGVQTAQPAQGFTASSSSLAVHAPSVHRPANVHARSAGVTAAATTGAAGAVVITPAPVHIAPRTPAPPPDIFVLPDLPAPSRAATGTGTLVIGARISAAGVACAPAVRAGAVETVLDLTDEELAILLTA